MNIDPQEQHMLNNARRWLDIRGYGFIEVGSLVWCKDCDGPCVVEKIGFSCDYDDDNSYPYVSVIHVDGDAYPGAGSMLRPSSFCAITDKVSISKSREAWNRDRSMYRHDDIVRIDFNAVVEHMDKLFDMCKGVERNCAAVVGKLTGRDRRYAIQKKRSCTAERIKVGKLRSLVVDYVKKVVV